MNVQGGAGVVELIRRYLTLLEAVAEAVLTKQQQPYYNKALQLYFGSNIIITCK